MNLSQNSFPERRYENLKYPAWIREIDLALPITPQLLITGNLRDVHTLPLTDPHGPAFVSTATVIADCLRENDFQVILSYDPIDGIRAVYESESGLAVALLPDAVSERAEVTTLGELANTMQLIVKSRHRVALIIDYASRLRQDDRDESPELQYLFATAEKLVHTATTASAGGRGVELFNPIFWLVDREVDLPHWLAASESVRVVSIPMPVLTAREEAAQRLVGGLPGARQASPEDLAALARRFAELTHGMTFRSMNDMTILARDRAIPIERIEEAARVYRVGVLDNPWQSEGLHDRIVNGEELIGGRVLGQPKAMRKSLDILSRAATGLTGAQSGGHSARPQGILFFAGPTGVGKTEMAKSLAEVLFGTEDAYTRFDMSEFSAEHSEARLIGAPPGYIGHDSGGELTNAVRQRPFSVLLFDEVEKAHPRILDKFLQVLEDGRLTDGSGSTVYFSDAVIVFTSNLGVYQNQRKGGVTERVPLVALDDPYELIESRVTAAIQEHFTIELQRPELLNRIGDNIVVFNFISVEIARKLVDLFLGNVATKVLSQLGVTLDIRPEVVEAVAGIALANRGFGGRGIGTAIETSFVNPLARELFVRGLRNTAVVVVGISEDSIGWSVTLA